MKVFCTGYRPEFESQILVGLKAAPDVIIKTGLKMFNNQQKD